MYKRSVIHLTRCVSKLEVTHSKQYNGPLFSIITSSTCSLMGTYEYRTNNSITMKKDYILCIFLTFHLEP